MRILITLLLCLSCLSAQVGPEDLSYMTENYPPYNYTDEYGILQGATVEIMREMWREMGIPKQEIRVYPWARAYHKIQTEKNHVLFTMSRSKERDSLFKWVGPISSSKHLLVGLCTDGKKIPIRSVNDAVQYKIGVVREDVGEQILLEHKVPASSMVQAITMKENIRKLMDGEVELISIGYDAMVALLKMNNQSRQFYIAYTISDSQDYIAFSLDVSDDIIARYNEALKKIELRHKEILEKYGFVIIDDNVVADQSK